MNVLLLNLTRLGDLLQSQAAVSDLTSQGHRVSLVCLGNFVEAGRLVQGLAHIFPFRAAALLKTLEKEGQPGRGAVPSASWLEALADLAAWRDEMHRVFKPDLVCNLTPSLAARMLGLFLSRGASRSGFAIDEHGFGINSNAWAAFLQGAAISREVSPFNIVDVFRKIAASQIIDGGCLPVRGNASLLPPPEETAYRMKRLLFGHSPEGCRGYVALQPGASEDRRRWPVEYFSALGQRLWDEEKLCPVLLGSKDEIPLAAKYASLAGHPHISLCGRTGLEELAAALTAMRMLITNDTGTMHLAAGLGVPVLAFFMATAQPFDTGPYQAGSCCLEPDMDCHPCAFGSSCPRDFACRRAIAPEFAASLALSRLRGGEWFDMNKKSGSRAPARVWYSEYDDRGFMSLRSLSGHDAEARTAWLMLQRRCLHPYLEEENSGLYPPPPLSGLLPVPEPAARQIATALAEISGFAELMLQQGKVLQQRPVPLMHRRFLGTWEKIHNSLRGNSWCGSLSLLWSRETQMEEQDFSSVLARTARFASLLRTLEHGLTGNPQ